jgi:hypothetical protein
MLPLAKTPHTLRVCGGDSIYRPILHRDFTLTYCEFCITWISGSFKRSKLGSFVDSIGEFSVIPFGNLQKR